MPSMIARAPLPSEEHSRFCPPKREPYWLMPPPSMIGVFTCPRKTSSRKPRAKNERLIMRCSEPKPGISEPQADDVAVMSSPGLHQLPGGQTILVANQQPSFTLPSKSMNCVNVTKNPPSIAAGGQLYGFHIFRPAPS